MMCSWAFSGIVSRRALRIRVLIWSTSFRWACVHSYWHVCCVPNSGGSGALKSTGIGKHRPQISSNWCRGSKDAYLTYVVVGVKPSLWTLQGCRKNGWISRHRWSRPRDCTAAARTFNTGWLTGRPCEEGAGLGRGDHGSRPAVQLLQPARRRKHLTGIPQGRQAGALCAACQGSLQIEGFLASKRQMLLQGNLWRKFLFC